MRRSSSSSSIPVRTSRLPVRDSTYSAQNRARSISRSQEQQSSLTKSSRTSSNPNLLDIPYRRNKQSGSLVRQTLCTPSSQSRYSRIRPSPRSSMKKDTRPITDKHWQFDQLSKVRNFVTKYFGHLMIYDVNAIKSGISLDVFVSLINSYFQLLDNQIFVMRDNYIEEVPKLLKCYGYPGNVKPSLLKTVNTPHSWPHILAIFAWLSDLISEISIPEDYAPFSGIHNVIYLHSLEILNKLHNTKESKDLIYQNCLDKLDKEIVQYLNLDVNLLGDIDGKIERLKSDLETSETRKTDSIKNLQVIEAETKVLTEKCDKFEQDSKTYLTQLEQQKNKHLEKIQKMGEEVQELRDKEKSLQAVVDSQRYSLLQKEELAKELESLQVTKDLAEQRRLQQQKRIHEYDSKLTELTQKIKSKAYEYNNIVNNLELCNPEFKKLHIRESGFARNDTEKELEVTTKMLQGAITEIKKASQSCSYEIEQLVQKEKKLQDSLDDAAKEVEELNKLDSELSLTLEFQNKQAELQRRKLCEEINKFECDLAELRKQRLDLTCLENEVRTLQQNKIEMEELLQKNRHESLFFFQQLQKQMNQTASAYMDIISSTTSAFENTMDIIEGNLAKAMATEHEGQTGQ